MKENPADPRTVLNNDCLAPEGYGEIIGGSQREDDYDKLLARIQRAGARSRRRIAGTSISGSTARSCTRGSGSGVERTVAWICGIPHIREAIAFPTADPPVVSLTPAEPGRWSGQLAGRVSTGRVSAVE